MQKPQYPERVGDEFCYNNFFSVTILIRSGSGFLCITYRIFVEKYNFIIYLYCDIASHSSPSPFSIVLTVLGC